MHSFIFPFKNILLSFYYVPLSISWESSDEQDRQKICLHMELTFQSVVKRTQIKEFFFSQGRQFSDEMFLIAHLRYIQHPNTQLRLVRMPYHPHSRVKVEWYGKTKTYEATRMLHCSLSAKLCEANFKGQ